jgi:uncharacterized membrane protein YqaE (UPF0057 family)
MKNIFTRLMLVLACAGLFMGDAVAAVSAPLPVPTSTEPDPAVVKAALAEFRSLSAKERRVRFKEARKAIKEYKAQQRAGKAPVAGTFLQVLFAILIPPLGVYLHEGEINKRFWIDLLLTLLFFLPGMIYALIVVLSK